jgi:hypothetical protein
MPSVVLPKHLLASISHETRNGDVSPRLVESAATDTADVYARYATCPEGLTTDEAAARLAKHGPIVLAKDLFVNQGPLTGESVSVEKFEVEKCRSAEGNGRTSHQGAPGAGRRCQGGYRRQRSGGPENMLEGGAVHGVHAPGE